MQQDILDQAIAQWRVARPDLDPEALGVVGRILRLAGKLENRANAALRPFELPVWAFDVLGALRRQGRPYVLSPTQLLQATVLSSGAMTNRIDRLEQQGFVCREPDPRDRRSLRVCLTPAGRKAIDGAVAARFAEAQAALQSLSSAEVKQLASLLRKLSQNIDQAPTLAAPASDRTDLPSFTFPPPTDLLDD